jgi:uncharacterized protein involved in outer membrane biogenesis
MKTERRKKLLVALLLLLLILIAAGLGIPRIFDLNRYKGWVASKIEEAVQGNVNIGHITWGFSDGVWLKADAFSISDALTFPVDLKLSDIYAKLAILPLLSKRLEIKELTIDGSEAVLRLEPEKDKPISFNQIKLSTLLVSGNPGAVKNGKDGTQPEIIKPGEKISQGTEEGRLGTLLPVEISVERLSVKNGRIRIDDGLILPDQRALHSFSEVSIEATDIIPGKKINFLISLRGEAATGMESFQAKGSFRGLIKTFIIEDPEIELNALISSLDTQIFKPYLKDSFLDNKLGGLVSLELNYKGDLFDRFDVAGSVDLTAIRYYDPFLWEHVLPGVKTVISYQTSFDPHDIRVDDLTLMIGDNTVKAHAFIESWDDQPVIRDISLSSNLLLDELIPLIPWKLLDKHTDKIRPIMEGGGHVDIDTLTLDDIKLTEPFPDPRDIIPELGLNAKISSISIPSIPDIPNIELVSCILKLDDGTVNIEELRTRAVSTSLPIISGKITHLVDDPLIQAKVLGELEIPEKMGTPGIRLLRKAGIEKLTGTAELDLAMTMKSSSPDEFRLEGSAHLKDFQMKTPSTPASLEKLSAKVDISSNRIIISNLSTAVVIPATKETQRGRFIFKLDGRIDDWRKTPVVLVQRLSTSSISLNPLVSVIPWDQIGDKADSLRDVLLAGGSLKINKLSPPKINVKKPPKDIKKVINKTKASISISDIEIQPHPAFPKFDGISGKATLENGLLSISETKGRMGPVTFPSIKLQATGFDDYLKIAASLKGPIKVTGTDNVAIEKLLRERGFKSLTGVSEIDMDFRYSQQYPEEWVARGSLTINGVNAESYPRGVRLDDLRGRVSFSRGKTTELTVEEISAKINQAPFRLAGKLTGGRTPDMLINGKVYTKELDLAEFCCLLPHLDYLKLTGKLDINLDFNIPQSNLKNTRLKGMLNARKIGIHLPDYNTMVKDTDIEIGFKDDTIQLIEMNININDQIFNLEGSASDPAEPKISLLVQSPNLDLDRLLPGDKKKAEPSLQEDNHASDKRSHEREKDLDQELPLWANNVTTDLRVNIDKGKYRDHLFNDLKIIVVYKKGMLQNYGINLHLADGKISATGSADLRDPDRISFIIIPDISNVRIGELSTLFEVEKMPLDGPLSISGQLEGEAGDVQDLVSSLSGPLVVDVGPGRIPEVKYLGKLATRVLTLINIRGLFSGALADRLQNEGIPFKAIKSESTFSNGNMNVNSFIFISDSMNANSQGVIKLRDKEIALQIILEPLQTVDSVLRLVPILGKIAKKLTNVYLTVVGPLDDPEIKTTLTKGITEAIKGTLRIPGTIFKDVDDLSNEINEYIKEEGIK